MSNAAIKRRIGSKFKKSVITPLASESEIYVKTKIQRPNAAPVNDKNLETKCVGDKIKGSVPMLETKCVGDKNNGAQGNKTTIGQNEAIRKPLLVPKSNSAKVSKLLNFNVNLKVTDLTKKEKKLVQFCERRIIINNRRLKIQADFRRTGLIEQKGIFSLHDSSDPDFWVTISLVGFTPIVIPRCGLRLLGLINFCPYITWEVVGVDGHSKSDLTLIGQILNQHVLFDNRISVQPIRFTTVEDKNSAPGESNNAPAPVPPPTAPPMANSTGFPNTPPNDLRPPVFVWRAEDRNLGSPAIRRQNHNSEKLNLPNLTVWNGVTRLIHNGLTTDPENERREMIFIST